MNTIAIIPCFKVKYKILGVVKKSLNLFDLLICIDDCCPEKSGDHILKNIKNKKVIVIKHKYNKGVGGALKTGFKYCNKIKPKVIVKLDGDNQIDPKEAKKISDQLLKSKLDYIVGSRFKRKKNFKTVPKIRWFGNMLISIVSKISSGLYHIDDFLNGLIAIKFDKLKKLSIDDIKDDFLFETDMLFKISRNKFKTSSYPMKVKYFKNNSNFRPSKEFFKFLFFNFNNFILRILNEYFYNNLKAGSICILLFLFFIFKTIYNIFFINLFYIESFLLSLFFITLFFVFDFSEKKGQ